LARVSCFPLCARRLAPAETPNNATRCEDHLMNIPDGHVNTASLTATPTRLGTDGCQTKRIILIRHGRSTWNEFLGQHRRAEREEQDRLRRDEQDKQDNRRRPAIGTAFKRMVGTVHQPESAHGRELLESHEKSDTPKGKFWQGVRGGIGRHVRNAISHAGNLHQVDHPLSFGGLQEARALRIAIDALVSDRASVTRAASSILECKHWYISPFLRALQTAAYALAPLYKADTSLRMRITPEANEIVNTPVSFDCQGKPGNVGFRAIARAISKTTELFEEDDDDPHDDALLFERQAEVKDVLATLCAMDVSEIGHTWWTDVKTFKKENLPLEDVRVRRLIGLLLEDPEPCIGVIAHSLLFQRLLTLLCPKDDKARAEVRAGLCNGDPVGSIVDPFHDKIVNCGTLVLTLRRPDGVTGGLVRQAAEISRAEFLFGGRMQGARAAERPVEDEALLPDEVSLELDRTLAGSSDDLL